MEATQTHNGEIPLMLIHGAWLSARSWENYADYFGKHGFAISAPEWPRRQGESRSYVRPPRRRRASGCRRSSITTIS